MTEVNVPLSVSIGADVDLSADGGRRVPMTMDTRITQIASNDYNDLENKPSINEVELVGNVVVGFGYSETSTVGLAEVGAAETGRPNYTPTGAITPMGTKRVMTGGSLSGKQSGNRLYLTMQPQYTVVNNGYTFDGAGVTFDIETGAE